MNDKTRGASLRVRLHRRCDPAVLQMLTSTHAGGTRHQRTSPWPNRQPRLSMSAQCQGQTQRHGAVMPGPQAQDRQGPEGVFPMSRAVESAVGGQLGSSAWFITRHVDGPGSVAQSVSTFSILQSCDAASRPRARSSQRDRVPAGGWWPAPQIAGRGSR
jgi:hypothetical protein